MKKSTALVGIIALFLGVMSMMILGATPIIAATLYEQEGDPAKDGPSGLNAAGQNTAADANYTNWKYQTGGGTWSGVYAAEDGWITVEDTGDMTLDVEADIEMFMSQTVSNNKIYFHLGDPYNATLADKTAYVQGTMTYNNGMYIGINFKGTGKDENSFEKDTLGKYTGVILDGMQSDNDTWHSQNNQMDLEIKLSWGAGWRPPVSYGDGAHHTITDTLWWLVADGAPGTYSYQWRVRLLPRPHQPDGDYYLDPEVIATPVI